MKLDDATIRIKNLRLRTFIGFNEEEMQKKQDVVINAVIKYDAIKAAENDNVDLAINYKVITKAVIKLVENNRFLLLEKLTHDILALCADHPWVKWAEVEVDKPHALRFADSVSLSIACSKDV
ncbi:dihydroneopterin triphosphate 2'-epimerase [Alteromonas sp. LMIT006]|jgi:D-erythro-7,8-dihydroneopterin triphosphate epimerase|uniref:dihydroneopterin triphosphate 2'-epimerase n=1 Tax=Alteromonadaceae TaxID=72275 RepID=UPI0019EC2207|nr:dihydroneopterin triphosphate 2'-epimerase [Alteromonas sp. LMIT006]MBE1288075.1 dihydroneopterin triphosphate 2'-epimerase [Alteromonadaceae bacterium]UTP72281.1 dihydroneopterin triphosphate 2'-epimerase [Alteromonas sp. LMIT006]